MCAELIYILFTILGLVIVDNFSTSIAVVTCGFLIYFYIKKFYKKIDKDRFVASLILKLWGGFFCIFRLWKYFFIIIRSLFFPQKENVNANLQSYSYYCGERACLEREIDIIVSNVSQYYLHSWYDGLSDNKEFIQRLNFVIKEALLKLCSHVIQLNRKRIAYLVLQLYLHFFIHFINAKKKSETLTLDTFEMKHWATEDGTTEWCYLQSLMSTLIDKFGPTDHQRSLHSKRSPILHNFIVEILTEHILYPLSNLLSDPSQLNSWLVKALEMYVKLDESIDDVVESNNLDLACNENYNLGPKIVLDTKDSSYSSSDSPEIKTKSNVSDQTFRVSYKTGCTSHEADEYERSDNISTLSELHSEYLAPLSSGFKSSSNINLLDNDILNLKTDNNSTCSPTSCDTSTIKRSKSADYIRQMTQLRALNVRDYNIVMQDNSNKMLVALKTDPNSSGLIEQAEEAVEVPNLFSDVRISDTLQQSEAGIVPYTLYNIKYLGVFHDTANSSEKPHFIKQEVNIKRRFREFLALQSRLEDNPTLKNYLKGIKGPSKWPPLPFSNMDKKNIAERKSFLENYLKELCSHGPIAQSSELQEFLAYGGDATVAFVRKAADINVPRIDKIFARGVKGAIDKFKTALPAGDGGASEGSNTNLRSNLDDMPSIYKFPEHLLEYSSREPEIRGLLKYYFNKLSNIPHFEETKNNKFDDYSERASLLRALYKLKIEKCCNCPDAWSINGENISRDENLLGNVIIDILLESLKSSQLNSCYLFSVIKLLLPPSVDRGFTSFIDGFSENHLAIFLHVIHKALWPSENSSDSKDSMPKVTSSSSSYIKLQKLIKAAVISSNVTMNLNWIQEFCLGRIYLFLSSIQHQKLNRCLLFHIYDVVIDTVCSNDN